MGLGEGFAPSAVTHVMATLVPASERSRAVSYVFGGLDLGSVIGLLLCGPLIAKFGWPSVFYVFGTLGLAWGVVWPLCKPTKVDPLVKKERELLAIKDEATRRENALAAGKEYVAKDSTQEGPVCLLACSFVYNLPRAGVSHMHGCPSISFLTSLASAETDSPISDHIYPLRERFASCRFGAITMHVRIANNIWH